LNRFHGWLATEKYIYTWGNQLYTAMLAIGSAGWTGHGKEAVLITLLEPQNDFIFAVIGKNYGFFGTASVLIVNLLLDLKLLSIALAYEHPRERYMVAGLLGMLVFQQFQNMGMVVGLLPITGITLPMISAGGSSLLSYMIPLAIVYHMSNEIKNKTIH
jgi:rod shape determining protein RodA